MDYVVYVDMKAKEFERILAGDKKMVLRGWKETALWACW